MVAKLESIAIVGIGCRFPGAKDLESFWHLMENARDTITEIPLERWNKSEFYDPDLSKPARMNTRWGSFLEKVDYFEPLFWGISPKETEYIDPQQRIMLEVAWEALENAGLMSDKLSGSQTGVFIGIGNSDYDRLLCKDYNFLNAYNGTGGSYSIAANRISYSLNLHGPSLAIDTACSSSLVAIHLACQSLRNGESNLALAGGINLVLSPEKTITFSKAGMMSPDGRCKTLDASANGYVRGEGGGILVLKRLSEALKDRDNIQAIIKGSAVNQDGLSNGLTAPNSLAQQAVILQALQNAAIKPSDISYVEMHGTGTSLGDPIEMDSLKTVLMENRSLEQRCWLGCVKTNIGHLEAASGVAGIIKVILSMQHGEIPPNLHFNQLNPYISLQGTPFAIPIDKCQRWSGNTEKRLLAGVSAFGFGGTNAHVILESSPRSHKDVDEQCQKPLRILTLSAKNEKSLLELTKRYKAHFQSNAELSLADVCYTANTGRRHFDYRLALIAESTEELPNLLSNVSFAKNTSRLFSNKVISKNSAPIAFLFTGQGSQYLNMGRQLYSTQSTFRKVLDYCDEILRSYLDKPLLEVLYPQSDRDSPLDETAYTQPALFALEYALAQLWKSWGINPSVVMGHSVGEYVAACIAGVFNLEDGLKLIAKRASLMQALPHDGEMIAVLTDQKTIEKAIWAYSHQVTIAALNGPENIVISGYRQAIHDIVANLQAKGIQTIQLKVSHAFHSPLMEPLLADFEHVAAKINYSPPNIPLISNLTGELVTDEIATPNYWCRHILEPVQFAATIKTLNDLGSQILLEIGPKSTLLKMGRRCLSEDNKLWLSSLDYNKKDWEHILQNLALLYVYGVSIDWNGFEQNYSRYRLSLPTYPWQSSSYWFRKTSKQSLEKTHLELSLCDSILLAGRHQAQQAPLDLALNTYPAKQIYLDRLTTAYIIKTLSSLGVYNQAGERHSINNLIENLNITPNYRKLIIRWLKKLVNFGILKQQEKETFTSDRPFENYQLKSLLKEAEELFRDEPFLIEYLQNCGNQLSEILTGKQTPLETLFPGGSLTMAENLYQEWAVPKYFNNIARSILEALVKNKPSGKPIRILEVGSGIGGTTLSLLPVLPPNATTYYFTDISDFFFSRAKKKFEAYPFIHYQLLDLEQEPQKSSFDYQSFDVIVAANVLHATRDIGKTLEHILYFLAPEGLLILNELTDHVSWLDISIGLMEGWYRFNDSWRKESPLFSKQQWEEILQDYGFENIATFPELNSPAELLGQHIITAKTPSFKNHRKKQKLENHEKTLVSSSVSFRKESNQDLIRQELLIANPESQYSIVLSFLKQEICKILGILNDEDYDVELPLTQVGLDSLMAIDLKTRIERNLKINISTPKTFQSLSLQNLTKQILEQIVNTSDNSISTKESIQPTTLKDDDLFSDLLFKIQPNGSKNPFVFVHPGGLDISCYTNLADYLRKDRPFYLLQPSELDNYSNFEREIQPPTPIDKIATKCIEVLFSLQPHGPYFLGGWSLGASLAFEIAQQLDKKGQKVALLALFDIANLANLAIEDDQRLLPLFASYLGARNNQEFLFNYQNIGLDEQLDILLQQAIYAKIVPSHSNVAEINNLFQIYKMGAHRSLKRVQNYKPQIYAERITLFESSDMLENFSEISQQLALNWINWGKLSSKSLEIHLVPGNHYTMLMNPSVQTLAEELQLCLDKW